MPNNDSIENNSQTEKKTIENAIEKTEDQWRSQLSKDEFHICRLKGTEAPFSGCYWDEKSTGVYHCTCCSKPLFDASSKYDSGSGWPSFYTPIDAANITEYRDTIMAMERVEITCQHCGSHLGHVFTDGPQPTGLRYCVNSASLKLKKEWGKSER